MIIGVIFFVFSLVVSFFLLSLAKRVKPLGKEGVQWVSFTGGEPLIREDIGEIVDAAASHNIFVNMNTNGVLLPEKFKAIKNVHRIHLSLDGPREINDSLRGQGAYDATLKAMEMLRQNGKKFRLATVLSSKNLNCLEEVFKLAESFGVGILFQPAILGFSGCEVGDSYVPEKVSYQQAIDYIINQKKAGKKVLNSYPGLKRLRSYPDSNLSKCNSGLINCDIEPSGMMIACDRYHFKQLEIDVVKEGFKNSFNLLEMISCKDCWCGSMIEFNYLTSLNVSSIINFVKTGQLN